MRPILFEVGPWQWWAYPIVVLALAAIVGLVQWLDRRSRPAPPLTSTNWLASAAFILIGAAIVVLAVNRAAPVSVHSYGVMLLVGIAAGVWWLNRSGRRHGFALDQWIDFALVILLCGVLGARLLYVMLHWTEYARQPLTMLYLWRGGLSFHGGLAGAIIAGYAFARIREISFPLLVDLAAPAVALGYAFARLGCFLNGCCYGHRCDLPWAVTFPAGTEAGASGFPRHPTQLYACAASLLIFAMLARLQRRINVHGNLFLGYLVLYSVYRFVVEFYRKGATAEVFVPLAPLTEAQTASIIIGLGALVWIVVRRRAAQSQAGQHK